VGSAPSTEKSASVAAIADCPPGGGPNGRGLGASKLVGRRFMRLPVPPTSPSALASTPVPPAPSLARLARNQLRSDNAVAGPSGPTFLEHRPRPREKWGLRAVTEGDTAANSRIQATWWIPEKAWRPKVPRPLAGVVRADKPVPVRRQDRGGPPNSYLAETHPVRDVGQLAHGSGQFLWTARVNGQSHFWQQAFRARGLVQSPSPTSLRNPEASLPTHPQFARLAGPPKNSISTRAGASKTLHPPDHALGQRVPSVHGRSVSKKQKKDPTK